MDYRHLRPLAALLTLGACGGVSADFSPPSVVTFQVACEGDGIEARELWYGISLWDELGVDVRIDNESEPDVVVCFVPDFERDGVTGLTSRRGGRATIELRSGMRADVIGPVFAHELGHAILPGSGDDNHLPLDELGILSEHVEGRIWSAADLEFLAGFGLPLAEDSPD